MCKNAWGISPCKCQQARFSRASATTLGARLFKVVQLPVKPCPPRSQSGTLWCFFENSVLDTDSFLEWFQIIHYWWLFYLAAILPNAIRLSAGLITWHYPFSWTILVLGCSGLAAELTIHCDCDIGLQPRYIECFAGIHASILHGDVLNHQNAANFIHRFTLVYFSSRVRALEVGKNRRSKSSRNGIVLFILSKSAT